MTVNITLPDRAENAVLRARLATVSAEGAQRLAEGNVLLAWIGCPGHRRHRIASPASATSGPINVCVSYVDSSAGTWLQARRQGPDHRAGRG